MDAFCSNNYEEGARVAVCKIRVSTEEYLVETLVEAWLDIGRRAALAGRGRNLFVGFPLPRFVNEYAASQYSPRTLLGESCL